MKHIIIAILIAMMLIPAMATAQETTEPEAPQWRVVPLRSIIWIGEDLIMNVNGTANTSYSLEMRPIGENNTLRNATYTGWHKTDINGTDWAVVPDGYNEEPGQYRVQVVLNQLVVASADVRLDFSQERWQDMRDNRQDERMDGIDEDIQDVVSQNADFLRTNTRLWNVIKVMLILFVILFMFCAELLLNYHIYKRKKAGKRPNRVALMFAGDYDEFFYQAGGIIYDKPPVLPRVVNGTDIGSTELHGKDTRGIIREIDRRMKHRKTPVRKMAPTVHNKKKWWRKAERKAAVEKVTGKTREPATYLDLMKEKDGE